MGKTVGYEAGRFVFGSLYKKDTSARCKRCLLLLLQASLAILLGLGTAWGQETTAGGASQEAGRHGPTAMEMVKLSHRPAGDVLETVLKALSPTGRASVDRGSNAVIVIDAPEQVAAIKRLIGTLDQPVPQLTIHLRFHRQSSPSRQLSTDSRTGAAGGRQLTAGGRPQDSQMMLRLSSGATGYIRSAADVPFAGYWREVCSRLGQSHPWMTGYRSLETGYEVMAQVIGNQVDLVLTPVLAFSTDHRIQLVESAVRTTVPLGQWVSLAALEEAGDSGAGIFIGGREQLGSALILEGKISTP